MAKRSHARSRTSPRRVDARIGTSTAPAARAATHRAALRRRRAARAVRRRRTPRRASACCIVRTSAARPRAPPRELDPRTTRSPCSARARACIAPSRERLTSTTVGRRRAPREERPLRPVQEREHPGAVAHAPRAPGAATTRTRSVASQRRATRPSRRPEQRATRLAPRRPQPLSSASLARARSSAGSFSMARSNICMALALSPCFVLISPR